MIGRPRVTFTPPTRNPVPLPVPAGAFARAECSEKRAGRAEKACRPCRPCRKSRRLDRDVAPVICHCYDNVELPRQLPRDDPNGQDHRPTLW